MDSTINAGTQKKEVRFQLLTLVPKRLRQLSQRSDETHCLLQDKVNANLEWVSRNAEFKLNAFSTESGTFV